MKKKHLIGGLSIDYWITKKMNAMGMMMFTWIWSGANRVVFEGIEPKWLARVDSMFWIEKGGESDFSKLHLHVKGLKQTRVDRNHPQLALAEGGTSFYQILSSSSTASFDRSHDFTQQADA